MSHNKHSNRVGQRKCFKILSAYGIAIKIEIQNKFSAREIFRGTQEINKQKH